MEIKEAAVKYTYADYATWDDGKRYELIDGVIYLMSPAPTPVHQEVLFELGWQLGNFLRGKPCKIYPSPFDVRLNAEGDADHTVVQPDISVICDMSKIDGKGCNGAPDFVIEILSPSSANRDAVLKYEKYLKAGVLEYWVVDLENKMILAHILDNGKYNTSVFKENDIVPVHVLMGCEINLKDVFKW